MAQSFKLKGRDCDELTTCALAVRDCQFIVTEFDVAHMSHYLAIEFQSAIMARCTQACETSDSSPIC